MSRVVTTLGAFGFDPESRRMRIEALHPGVTRAAVQDHTGFPLLDAPQVTETAPPSADELEMLRALDHRRAVGLLGQEAHQLTEHTEREKPPAEERALFAGRRGDHRSPDIGHPHQIARRRRGIRARQHEVCLEFRQAAFNCNGVG